MKVFVAGATGAIGKQLVPRLLAAGHEVTALTRSPDKAEALLAAGVEPVVADALDRDAIVAAVARAQPEVVVHVVGQWRVEAAAARPWSLPRVTRAIASSPRLQ